MNIRCALPLLVACALIGCESDRYHWNLSHVYVTPQTHISHADIEEIVWLVTQATLDPIRQISSQVTVANRQQVFVDAESSTGPRQEFILQKTVSGWRIISHEQSLDR